MERQRTLFYGFIIGFILLTVPIHPFFFWEDVTDVIEDIFHYLGIILFILCGVPLIFKVFKGFFN